LVRICSVELVLDDGAAFFLCQRSIVIAIQPVEPGRRSLNPH
jgi:hypothetical protein